MDKRYLSVKEVAEYLGRTEKSIYISVGRRQLPYRKLGKKLVFDRLEIDKFIAALPGATFEDALAGKYPNFG
jgi:excisionase family DNA binding protein